MRGCEKVSNDQIECWEEAQLGQDTQEAGAQLGHTGAGDSTRRIPRRPNQDTQEAGAELNQFLNPCFLLLHPPPLATIPLLARGNNIAEVKLDTAAACKQPHPQETGVVSVTKTLPPSSRRLMAPLLKCGLNCLQCWNNVFQVPERRSTHHFFLRCFIPGLAIRFPQDPFFDQFHWRPNLDGKRSLLPK